MDILTITDIQIFYEAKGSKEEVPLKEFMNKHRVKCEEMILTRSFDGILHYYISFLDGTNRKISYPKNEFGKNWGYVIENLLEPWRLIYEWITNTRIHGGRPLKAYKSLYEYAEENWCLKSYKNLIEMSVEEATEEYGNLWEPFDESAEAERRFHNYFENDFGNSRKDIEERNCYYDQTLEELINVTGSMDAFRRMIINLQW